MLDAFGVEDGALAHFFFHKPGLGGADSVFSRERAPEPKGCLKDGLQPVPLLLVPAVRQDGGVEIAVPGVAEGADGEIKAAAWFEGTGCLRPLAVD